jgi:hypothetical protein
MCLREFSVKVVGPSAGMPCFVHILLRTVKILIRLLTDCCEFK